MGRTTLLTCLACWVVLSGPFSSQAYAVQSDSLRVARATLRDWEQQMRLAIFDRGGSFSGRTGDRGILERFNEAMDAEYDLDVISSTFSLTETYEWYQRANGARYWGGSIDHLQLVQGADLRTEVPLGGTWSADVWFTHEHSLRVRRNLLWLGFSKRFSEHGTRAFLQGTLSAEKPEADIEAGFVWSSGRSEVTFAIAALDLFSDLIYQDLEVDPRIEDQALDYTAHPFTARLAADLSLGPTFRIEAFGLILTPTTLLVESQTRPGTGFEQDERYAYAGGQLAWQPSQRSAIGGFATWVRARTHRAPLSTGSPDDDFDLTESSWSAGIYAIHRFQARFALESWLAHVWRDEDRLLPDAATTGIAYMERTWASRNSLIYRAASGFRGDLGLDFTARNADDPAPVPTLEPLEKNNFRLRGDLGWHFDGRAMFLVGGNLDLDEMSFDGAHGRFMLFW